MRESLSLAAPTESFVLSGLYPSLRGEGGPIMRGRSVLRVTARFVPGSQRKLARLVNP